jgi:hypothetical protein
VAPTSLPRIQNWRGALEAYARHEPPGPKFVDLLVY